MGFFETNGSDETLEDGSLTAVQSVEFRSILSLPKISDIASAIASWLCPNFAEKPCNSPINFSSVVLDSLHEGIMACDHEGNLTLINYATKKFHGLLYREIPAKNWEKYFTLYRVDGSQELSGDELPLRRALNGEVTLDQEVLILGGDGPARYCIINGQPIFGDDNTVLGAVVVLHDISDRRQAEQEAMRLASIVECSADAVMAINLDGTIVSWNAAASNLYGLKATEVVGCHTSILGQTGNSNPYSDAIKAVLKGVELDPIETVLSRSDGTKVDVSLRISPIQDSSGNLVGLSTMSRDITVQKIAEAELRDSQKRLAEAQRIARMGSWEHIIETGVLVWSNEMYRLFAFDPTSGPPSTVTLMRRYHPDDVRLHQQCYDDAIGGGKGYEIDVRVTLPGLPVRHYHTVGEPVLNEVGKVVRIAGTVMDISERKQAQQTAREATIALEFQKKALEEANIRLEALATIDGLTGLRNRRALDSLLEHEFARSSRYHVSLSLLLIDIDKFKTFNDSYGHQAGDDVLREVAKILMLGTRDTDLVARYGGEEICILLPETAVTEAVPTAERLRLAVANGAWDRQQVTISIGVASIDPSMKSVSELIMSADKALYRSKAEGRNRVTLAEPADTCLQVAA